MRPASLPIRLLMIFLPSVTIAAVAAGLQYRRVDTAVDILASVSQVDMTGVTQSRSPLRLGFPPTNRIGFSRFKNMSFAPIRLSSIVDNTGAATSRRRLTPLRLIDRSVSLVAATPQATVLVETIGGPSLTASSILVSEGVSLRLAGHSNERVLLVRPGVPSPRLGLAAVGTITVRCSGCELTGVSPRVSDVDFALQADLSDVSPIVDISGERRAQFAVTLNSTTVWQLYSGEFQVAALDFVQPSAGGDAVSSMVAEGKLSYTGRPGVDSVVLTPGEPIIIGPGEKLSVRRLSIEAEATAIVVHVAGDVSRLLVGAPEATDRRLTALTALWHARDLKLWFMISAWALSSTLAVYKFVREVQSHE